MLNSKTAFETYENITAGYEMTTFKHLRHGKALYITTVFKPGIEIAMGTSAAVAVLTTDNVELNYSVGVNGDGIPILFWANDKEIRAMPMGANARADAFVYGTIMCLIR